MQIFSVCRYPRFCQSLMELSSGGLSLLMVNRSVLDAATIGLFTLQCQYQENFFFLKSLTNSDLSYKINFEWNHQQCCLIILRRLFCLSDGTYQSAGAHRGHLLKLNPTKCAEYSAHKYPPHSPDTAHYICLWLKGITVHSSTRQSISGCSL